MGVSFFFILSGFLMSQGYMTKVTTDINRFNLPRFIVKRLSKLYPLHIICLISSIILKVSINRYDISNLLLLQSWIPFKEWYFSGNAVGWCLSDFLFFLWHVPVHLQFLKIKAQALPEHIFWHSASLYFHNHSVSTDRNSIWHSVYKSADATSGLYIRNPVMGIFQVVRYRLATHKTHYKNR